MSDWGRHCYKCGHPAAYHGMTFCVCDAGGSVKRQCDCDGYADPDLSCRLCWERFDSPGELAEHEQGEQDRTYPTDGYPSTKADTI